MGKILNIGFQKKLMNDKLKLLGILFAKQELGNSECRFTEFKPKIFRRRYFSLVFYEFYRDDFFKYINYDSDEGHWETLEFENFYK